MVALLKIGIHLTLCVHISLSDDRSLLERNLLQAMSTVASLQNNDGDTHVLAHAIEEVRNILTKVNLDSRFDPELIDDADILLRSNQKSYLPPERSGRPANMVGRNVEALPTNVNMYDDSTANGAPAISMKSVLSSLTSFQSRTYKKEINSMAESNRQYGSDDTEEPDISIITHFPAKQKDPTKAPHDDASLPLANDDKLPFSRGARELNYRSNAESSIAALAFPMDEVYSTTKRRESHIVDATKDSGVGVEQLAQEFHSKPAFMPPTIENIQTDPDDQKTEFGGANIQDFAGELSDVFIQKHTEHGTYFESNKLYQKETRRAEKSLLLDSRWDFLDQEEVSLKL